MQKIYFKLEGRALSRPIDFHQDWSRRSGTLQNSGAQFEPFGLSHGRIVSLYDRFRAKKIDHRLHNQLFSLIHRQGQRLENKKVAVAIEDHAGKSVAFAPNDAATPRINLSPVTVFVCLRDAAFEKIEIKILALPGKTAGDDLRFRIVDRAPD